MSLCNIIIFTELLVLRVHVMLFYSSSFFIDVFFEFVHLTLFVYTFSFQYGVKESNQQGQISAMICVNFKCQMLMPQAFKNNNSEILKAIEIAKLLLFVKTDQSARQTR